MNDIEKCDTVLKNILRRSYSSNLIRFPGGSFGTKLAGFRAEVKHMGYEYIDWNSLNGDSEAIHVPENMLIKIVKESTNKKNEIVVLMHDSNTKQTTVDALPQIIEYLKSKGYTFKTLQNYQFKMGLQDQGNIAK